MAKITRWNSEKGFGFVRHNNKDVFIHVTAIEPRQPRGVDLTNREVEVLETTMGPKGLKVVSAKLMPSKEELAQAEAENIALEAKKAAEAEAKVLKGQLEKVIRELNNSWYNWGEKVRQQILSTQSPMRRPEMSFCPDCGQEVSYRPAGMGKKYTCQCGWWHFVSLHEVNRQVYTPESPDEMRPAGYYDTRGVKKVEDGGPPPRIEHELRNAAARVISNSGWFSALEIPILSITGALAWTLNKVEKLKQIFTELQDFPEPPNIPSELGGEELFAWAKSQSGKAMEAWETIKTL